MILVQSIDMMLLQDALGHQCDLEMITGGEINKHIKDVLRQSSYQWGC